MSGNRRVTLATYAALLAVIGSLITLALHPMSSLVLLAFSVSLTCAILLGKLRHSPGTKWVRRPILIVAALLLIGMLVPPTHATVISEYVLPGVVGPYGYDPRPLDLWVDPGGYVWFTEQYAHKIGSLAPDGSTFYEWDIPTAPLGGEPWGIAANLWGTSDYRIWFTDYKSSVVAVADFGSSPASFNSFPLVPGSEPRGIVVTDNPSESGLERDMAWFTEYTGNNIGCLYYDSGWKIKEYNIPTSNSGPMEIVNSTGNVLFFTEYLSDKIGMLDPATGVFKEFQLPDDSGPWGITVDQNSFVWFTMAKRDKIARLNPWTGEITEYGPTLTGNSEPRGIAVDPRTGNVWFAQFSGQKIGKYIPGENIFVEYSPPTPGSNPFNVAVKWTDSQVRVWFTEWSGNRIGSLSQPDQYVTTTTVPQITSANTIRFTSSSTTSEYIPAAADITPDSAQTTANQYVMTASSTTIRTDTLNRLSTSTFLTTTSTVTEVQYTTTTYVSTSTSYVATTSVTTSTTSTSISTSYYSTTSGTMTKVSTVTEWPWTSWKTYSTTVSANVTFTTTQWSTSYKSTTTTTTTTTSPVYATSTRTTYTPLARTETSTTTITTSAATSRATTTYPWPTSCIIASAAYGSDLSPEIQFLRYFRDRLVLSTFAGGSFMNVFNNWYYSFSPSVASVVAVEPWLAAAVRALLYPLLVILHLASMAYAGLSFSPELAVVTAGVVASALIGAVYHSPWITALLVLLKRRRNFLVKLSQLKPFVPPWIATVALVVAAEIGRSPVLMMIATSTLVLSTVGLSAMAAAIILARRIW